MTGNTDSMTGLASSAGTADNLPQASDAEIAALIGAPAPEEPPKPATPAAPAKPATPAAPAASPQEPTRPVGRPAQKRDYTGLEPDEIEIFEKMGNKSFDKLLPIYLAHKKGQPPADVQTKLSEYEKQLAEANDRKWWDHEDAYKLSPEYNEAVETASTAAAVADHWAQQLVEVDNGAKECVMLRAGQNGIETFKVAVTPQTRADLIRRLTQSQQDVARVRAGLDEVKQKHTSRWKGYSDTLSGIYDQHFKPHQELLKPFYNKIIEGFPAWFRNRPEARLLASSLASNQLIEQKYAAQLGQQKTAAQQQRAKQSSGPTQEELQQGTSTPASSTTYTEEEYNRIRSMM